MKTFFDKLKINNIRYEYPKNNSLMSYKTTLFIINKFIEHHIFCKRNDINSHHEIVINNKKITLFVLSTEYRQSILFSYKCDFNWFSYKLISFYVLRKYNFIKNDTNRFYHILHLFLSKKEYYL
jgi:hypothetical protein